MLKAYFDDSGTHNKSPVVVVGGLLGLKDDWTKLDSEWRAKLAAPLPGKPPLKAFHLSHCCLHEEEFRDYTTTEGDVLRHDLRQIMLRAGLYQLSYVVSRADWDELVLPQYRGVMGSAEEACFLSFVMGAIDIVRKANNPGLKIAFVYDLGRKTPRFEELIRLIEDPKFRPEVASVSWGRVAEMPPLQAADTIATENYWASQKWLSDGDLRATSSHFKRLLNGMAGEGFILDREAIQAEINRRGPDGKVR